MGESRHGLLLGKTFQLSIRKCFPSLTEEGMSLKNIFILLDKWDMTLHSVGYYSTTETKAGFSGF